MQSTQQNIYTFYFYYSFILCGTCSRHSLIFSDEKQAPVADKQHTGIAYTISYISSFLIYITILLYGTMVMRGVSEEKTNRIAEIIISSVRPFQLMMGKIIGIGAAGLTQFLIWILLIVLFSSAATLFIPPDVTTQINNNNPPPDLSSVNLPLIIISFILFYIRLSFLCFTICGSR